MKSVILPEQFEEQSCVLINNNKKNCKNRIQCINMKVFSVLILQVFDLYLDCCTACRVSELNMSEKLIDPVLSFYTVSEGQKKKNNEKER